MPCPQEEPNNVPRPETAGELWRGSVRKTGGQPGTATQVSEEPDAYGSDGETARRRKARVETPPEPTDEAELFSYLIFNPYR